jgi:hypothetical protein
LVREAWKVANTICEGVNEMKYIVANIVFNLCYGELYEVGEVARLEVILVEDEIAYHRSIWDASPSITVLDTSTSDPGPSTR